MEIETVKIHRSPFQLRPVKKHTRAFCQLRNSISRQGILQPLLLRPPFEIVDGASPIEVEIEVGG